ncbi:hypothetical protein CSUI_000181 [Cystoisospora suis]|uniref:Uncharacterized protein n=1 Tax=Cystoisospora suis TaxID=483139 RepID=A0A2C6LI07_9APIC|nr:hypothetical protein CSUI_000181 [Cystoisospora suis]
MTELLYLDRFSVEIPKVARLTFFRLRYHPAVIVPFGVRSAQRFQTCFPFDVGITIPGGGIGSCRVYRKDKLEFEVSFRYARGRSGGVLLR